MKNELSEIRARHAREMRETEIKFALLESLGDVPSLPTVANIAPEGKPSTYCGFASLSFSGPAYDPDQKHSPQAIARAMEAAGWKLAPATRAKYGTWRSQMAYGTQENLPETRDRDELKDSWPSLPVWVIPNQFTPCDVECWMVAPDGKHYKVSIDAPGLASIHARRVESLGTWRFASGSAKVQIPEGWHALQDANGETFATVSERLASVDTEQGLSGRVSFQLDRDEQDAFPLTLSEVLKALGTR